MAGWSPRNCCSGSLSFSRFRYLAASCPRLACRPRPGTYLADAFSTNVFCLWRNSSITILRYLRLCAHAQGLWLDALRLKASCIPSCRVVHVPPRLQIVPPPHHLDLFWDDINTLWLCTSPELHIHSRANLFRPMSRLGQRHKPFCQSVQYLWASIAWLSWSSKIWRCGMDHPAWILWLAGVLHIVDPFGQGPRRRSQDGNCRDICLFLLEHGELEPVLLLNRNADCRFQLRPGRKSGPFTSPHLDGSIHNSLLCLRFPSAQPAGRKDQAHARVWNPALSHPHELEHRRQCALLVVPFQRLAPPLHLPAPATQEGVRNKLLPVRWKNLVFALLGAWILSSALRTALARIPDACRSCPTPCKYIHVLVSLWSLVIVVHVLGFCHRSASGAMGWCAKC